MTDGTRALVVISNLIQHVLTNVATRLSTSAGRRFGGSGFFGRWFAAGRRLLRFRPTCTRLFEVEVNEQFPGTLNGLALADYLRSHRSGSDNHRPFIRSPTGEIPFSRRKTDGLEALSL